MQIDPRKGRVTATLQELATYGMFLSEALFELLAERGVLREAEVKARLKKLSRETTVILRKPNG